MHMDLSLRHRVLCSVFIVPADDLAFVNIVIRSHNRSGIQCLNMASSNPRKFSEKIALHTQKQAEETADFEKIMNEVRSAKPNQIVSIGVSLLFTVYRRHTPNCLWLDLLN